MRTMIFRIEGMRCEACANTIKGLVERQPGVRLASVSFEHRQARVLYDPESVEADQLVESIQRPGFRVIGQEAIGDSARPTGSTPQAVQGPCMWSDS
jgi:copper chaperone